MKKILIFVDRDGTVVYDKKTRPKYFLGRQRNWKSKVKFITFSIKGLKLLRKKLPNSKIYLISNHQGVAIKDYPLLTKKRSHKVFRYILKKLKEKGFEFDGYEFCPEATPEYVKSHSELKFYKKLVKNSKCFKPKPGMLKSILKKEKLKEKYVKIYVLGDRVSDVKTAHNINGFGILVLFGDKKEEKEKVKKLKSTKKYISKNFLDAARFIVKRESL